MGECGILGVCFGVEWSDGHWESVEHVEVGVVLFADDLSQFLLHSGAEVVLECLLFRGVDTGLLQQCNTIHIVQSKGLAVFGQLEIAGFGVGFLDNGNLVLVALLELGEDEDKKFFCKVKNLVIVMSEGLFKIETSKLLNVNNLPTE